MVRVIWGDGKLVAHPGGCFVPELCSFVRVAAAGRADDLGRAWCEGLKWLAKHLVGGAAAECERREHGGNRVEGGGGDGDADHVSADVSAVGTVPGRRRQAERVGGDIEKSPEQLIR